jgi:hypothetical protein
MTGVMSGVATPALANDTLEFQVMAAMLYNFTKYVEWPANPGIVSNQLTICIAGNNPFNDNFAMYQNKVSKGKTIKIKSINGPQEVQGCNMLFIEQSEQARLAAYLLQTSRLSILTVSNIRHFATDHGIIGFIRRDDRVGFEINLEEARRSQLNISSNLLKLAVIVP